MSRTGRRELICVLTFFILATVSCQIQVRGFTGDTVLLPCVYTGSDSLPQSVTAFWRDKDDNNVLDIKQNVPDFAKQNQKFRGRVDRSSDLNQTGIFSIILKNLQQSDSGPYDCNVPVVDFKSVVILTVSEKPAVKMTTPAAVTPSPTATKPSGAAAETLTSLCLTLLCGFLPLILSP